MRMLLIYCQLGLSTGTDQSINLQCKEKELYETEESSKEGKWYAKYVCNMII
jgi:hypothetical protein